MKRLMLASAGVIALFASGAMAQDAAPPPPDAQQDMQAPPPGAQTQTTTTQTMSISPDNQTVIRKWVRTWRTTPAPVQDVTIGMTVPESVDLQPVPQPIYSAVPEPEHYRVFLWNNHVVFVDPVTRRVVNIVD